jgi:hypothetical protein
MPCKLNTKTAQSSGSENIAAEKPLPGLIALRSVLSPTPHNPRKQRTNPAAAGSGVRFGAGEWRREWA